MNIEEMQAEVEELEAQQAKIQRRKMLLIQHIAWEEYNASGTKPVPPPPLEEADADTSP